MSDEKDKIILKLKRGIVYSSMTYISALIAALILVVATTTKGINPFETNLLEMLALFFIIVYSKMTVKCSIIKASVLNVDILRELKEDQRNKK